ncbi:pyridoxal-dependent decarboxylase [Spongiactinospora sp. TRM90649]|uniref:pyridoxal phosphate-dependent decarboxylase family protein n=1 Tax=Spongiactinospora sp. TRM90649 TaxID=3031114 RepID=UPI0023F65B56|nr:pyridoxal-dependent decarboxylase [Spongiactinospora sp. TRM90649]MDF5756225.1 pyridoxal-dependent decarboxylase [Spongiactinospora sp. TRM90649]
MDPDRAPLRLTAEEMRRFGYAAVDLVIDRLTGPRAPRPGRPDTDRLRREPIPTGRRPPEEVLGQVAADILPPEAVTDDPRHFSYLPGAGNYVGAIADFMASSANVSTEHWLAGERAARVEEVVLDWVRVAYGLPETAGGLFTGGGIASTLTALHAARAERLGRPDARGRVYVGDQSNPAIARGLAYLGFGSAQVRTLTTDGRAALDPADLEAAIRADRAEAGRDAGATPFCVVATAGTMSTGAVDPLEEIADICAEHGVWLHVDATYGGAATVVQQGRRLLRGLERADSIAVDPYKWWSRSYDVGCTLFRDGGVLRRAFPTFAGHPAGDRDAHDPANVHDNDARPSHGFHALHLWMSLQVFGLDTIHDAVEHGIALAEYAEKLLRERAHWRIVTPAQLGIVTFRPHLPQLPPDAVDRITGAVARATLDDGHALVLTTDVGGRPVLRLRTTHPETVLEDLTSTIALLDRLLDAETTISLTGSHTESHTEPGPVQPRFPRGPE